jgi:hypothetical protein
MFEELAPAWRRTCLARSARIDDAITELLDRALGAERRPVKDAPGTLITDVVRRQMPEASAHLRRADLQMGAPATFSGSAGAVHCHIIQPGAPFLWSTTPTSC